MLKRNVAAPAIFVPVLLKMKITIVDTETCWTVRGEEFASKGTYTPLEGKKLCGDIAATFFRGNIVFQR